MKTVKKVLALVVAVMAGFAAKRAAVTHGPKLVAAAKRAREARQLPTDCG